MHLKRKMNILSETWIDALGKHVSIHALCAIIKQ